MRVTLLERHMWRWVFRHRRSLTCLGRSATRCHWAFGRINMRRYLLGESVAYRIMCRPFRFRLRTWIIWSMKTHMVLPRRTRTGSRCGIWTKSRADRLIGFAVSLMVLNQMRNVRRGGLVPLVYSTSRVERELTWIGLGPASFQTVNFQSVHPPVSPTSEVRHPMGSHHHINRQTSGFSQLRKLSQRIGKTNRCWRRGHWTIWKGSVLLKGRMTWRNLPLSIGQATIRGVMTTWTKNLGRLSSRRNYWTSIRARWWILGNPFRRCLTNLNRQRKRSESSRRRIPTSSVDAPLSETDRCAGGCYLPNLRIRTRLWNCLGWLIPLGRATSRTWARWRNLGQRLTSSRRNTMTQYRISSRP